MIIMCPYKRSKVSDALECDKTASCCFLTVLKFFQLNKTSFSEIVLNSCDWISLS